jgi:hypothetical protein
MSAGDLKGGFECLQETRKEVANACRRLERRLRMYVCRRLKWRLWMSAGDLKGGCGCMYET